MSSCQHSASRRILSPSSCIPRCTAVIPRAARSPFDGWSLFVALFSVPSLESVSALSPRLKVRAVKLSDLNEVRLGVSGAGKETDPGSLGGRVGVAATFGFDGLDLRSNAAMRSACAFATLALYNVLCFIRACWNSTPVSVTYKCPYAKCDLYGNCVVELGKQSPD